MSNINKFTLQYRELLIPRDGQFIIYLPEGFSPKANKGYTGHPEVLIIPVLISKLVDI